MNKALKIQMTLTAIDKMSGVVNRAVTKTQKRLRGMSRSADAIAKKGFQYGRQALQVGAVAGAMLYPAINSAIQFEKQMGNVGTLIDTNTESMERMGRSVLDISTRIPVQVEELTSALYDVRSAGVSAEDSMMVLEASGRLAVAGLSTTKEATNIMTSAINAFASEGLSAAQISDMVFKTVKAGKTTVSELSQAFGSTAPIIQAAGVKLADFQAATAALTTLGTPASQAQNQLRASMVALQKPTANMSKVLKALGVRDGRELIKTTGSMGAAFETIVKQSKAMGYNLEQVTGRVEAAAAMTSIAGATNEAYLKTLASMTDGSDSLNEAFGKQTEKAAAQMQLAKNSINSAMIEIGSIMLPIVAKIAKKLVPIVKSIGTWAREHPGLTKVIFGTIAAISALLVVFGSMGMMIGGVASGISAISSALAIIAPGFSMAAAGAKLFSIAFMGIPIIGWIAAIIAAGVLIYTYWDEISAYFVGIWDSISAAFDQGFIQGIFEVLKQLNPMFHIAKMWNSVIEYFFGINLYEAGANIFQSIIDGLKSKFPAVTEAMEKIVGGIRDFLPFSPAKTGPLRSIMKVRIVESIAETMKPGPAVKAMKKVAVGIYDTVTAPVKSLKNAAGDMYHSAKNPVRSVSGMGGDAALMGKTPSGQTIQLTYAPQVHLMGGGGTDGNIGDQVLAALASDKDQLLKLIREAMNRESKKSY